MGSSELAALYAVVPMVDAAAPTACREWTAHQLVAHLAAGAKERADLIEEALAGLPERATTPFAERGALAGGSHLAIGLAVGPTPCYRFGIPRALASTARWLRMGSAAWLGIANPMPVLPPELVNATVLIPIA